jgi:hypothetical protein
MKSTFFFRSLEFGCFRARLELSWTSIVIPLLEADHDYPARCGVLSIE